MKLQEAIDALECSMTDFDLAWAIEKTIAAAKVKLVGEEPEDASEHEIWEDKSEAYEELLEYAGSMSDAIGEFDDAYTEFEEEPGDDHKVLNADELSDWIKDYEEDGPLDEQFCAQDLFNDFKYAYEDFQDEYGGLEDLELINEE